MNAHTREPFHIRILKGLLGIIWSIDWPLMVIVLILSAWGFVALYSAGYSFPVNWNVLNISLEYGNSLSAPSNYIKESYWMVTFNCSIIDQWFKIKKFN